MASTTSAPKANELLGRVERIALAAAVDEVELQRIAAEAEKLKRVDAAGAYAVLGSVAAVRGDSFSSTNHYRAALRLNRDVTTWWNFSTSLALVDEHDASLEVAREGLLDYPDNPTLLRRAADAAAESGHFIEAEAFCQRWDKLVPDREYPMRDRIRELAAAVEMGLMSETGARGVIAVLTAVQREEGARTMGAEIIGGDDAFLYDRAVRCSAAQASRMNWRVVSRIVDSAELSKDPGRVFQAGFVGVGGGGST